MLFPSKIHPEGEILIIFSAVDYEDDVLREIFLRLPPQPSALLRASLVCKRWSCLISDHGFLQCFHDYHQRPPLLGFFVKEDNAIDFIPMLDAPDRIPTARFSLTIPRDECWSFKGCRHGLALFLNWTRHEAVVWDPISRHQRPVPFPPEFGNDKANLVRNAAMVCAATDRGHVHGDCQSSPFKLVLLRNSDNRMEVLACLYDSKSGVWGHIISTKVTDVVNPLRPGILIGGALCWLLSDDCILEFDLNRNKLDVTERPIDSHAIADKSHFQVLRTKGNILGLAILTRMMLKLWERMDFHDGCLTWVLRKTVDLGKLLQLEGRSWDERLVIRGSDEDNNVIIIHTNGCGVFMVELESMQVKSVDERSYIWSYYPYSNFYMAGREFAKISRLC